MALWENNSINSIFVGTSPNDGTGDDIRTSFIKVDTNFANVSSFLASSTVDFLNANIRSTINAPLANIVSINSDTVTANSISVVGMLDGNITVNDYFVNNGTTTLSGPTNTANLVVNGTLSVTGNTRVSANIVPTVSGAYDLGSAALPFRNLYVQATVSTTQVAASSDAGLLSIHANAAPGDYKDIGVFGKYNKSGANAYAFFGFQYSTESFVYKQTANNVTLTDSVVDGIYGNVHAGSLYLSNLAPSTSTTNGALIVAGGVGIAGNLNAANITSPTIYGNLVSTVANIGRMSVSGSVAGTLNVDNSVVIGGSPAVTVATLQNYGAVYSAGVVSGVQAFLSSAPSTSSSTGAIVVPNGGVGVFGNVVAGGFVGPYYGLVQVANQTNITGVGTLGNLTVAGVTNTSALQASNLIGTKDFVATGNTFITNLTGITTLNLSGNLTAGGFIGAVYGPQGNITAVGTLSGLTVSGNTAINSTLYGRGVFDNGTRVVSGSTGSGNLVVSNGGITMATHGPGITTVGGTTSIPVITTDIYGRITSLTSASISTTLSTAGTSGSSGAVALASQSLSFAGSGGITAVASGSTITIAMNSAPVFATVTTGNILPSANNVSNIGSSTSAYNTIFARATSAQYADLAEKYVTDAEYPVGTVIVIGGEKEATAGQLGDKAIGVISAEPAYLMNSESNGQAVALKGRVPVRVVNPVKKGQRLIAGPNGTAQPVYSSHPDVFGIALESNDSYEEKIIEAVIL